MPNHAAPVRALLVEMPFKAVDLPNLGLSLVKATVVGAGIPCVIRYANLDFACAIGVDVFTTIAQSIPQELLAGDLVFAPLVSNVERRRLDGSLLGCSSPRQTVLEQLPDRISEQMGELQRAAGGFVAQLADEICESRVDVVGLSSMFQLTPNLALAKSIKLRRPDIVIIMGGAHCQGEMGPTIFENFPWIDFVCSGEGELVLAPLLTNLSRGRPGLDSIPGLVWSPERLRHLEKRRFVVETKRNSAPPSFGAVAYKRIMDLDQLPVPSYRGWLAEWETHPELIESGAPRLPIETSRGCWWGEKQHCIFCGLTGESLAFRRKSPERVLREFVDLATYGIPEIYAVDLILDQAYFRSVLPELARRKLGLGIFFEIKSNLTHSHIRSLRDAGITQLQPGIESLSTPVLQLMRKGVQTFQNLRVLKWAAEMGIGLSWNLLYGFPGEEPEHYRDMPDLIRRIPHLQPPFAGCHRIRMDRFSPLHSNPAAFGLRDVAPVPAYKAVYDLPDSVLDRLSYYFEYEQDLVVDEAHYMDPVRRAVTNWERSFGQSSFVSIDVDGALYLFDRRSEGVATESRLEDDSRSLYLACDAGASLKQIAHALSLPEVRVSKILEEFLARDWIVAVDGKFVSLAVVLDDVVPQDTPRAILAEVCHAVYCARSRSLAASVREAPPEELEQRKSA